MKIRRYIPVLRTILLMLLTLVFTGSGAFDPVLAGQETKELKGVLLDKSYKAKLLSLQVGKEVWLFHYDQETAGLDEAGQGDNVALRYHEKGEIRKAVEVIPELPEIPAGVEEIDVEDLLAMLSNKLQADKYLLVDCRSADLYAEAHLPTAVSIPWSMTREAKLAALPEDKEQLLIFYCMGPTCLLGPNSAALAVEAGHKNVKILLVELSDWQENGGRLYSGDDHIAKGNVVLVDLRNGKEAEAGHIPGAINIPASDIPEAEYDFPAKKSAPVIVYGNGKDPESAAATIQGWGFHQVSLVEGGYEGWLKRGNPVKKGKIPSQIKWQRLAEDGEVSIEDFRKVFEGKSDAAVIVDVRTPAESDKGSFAKALRMPLTEIQARLAEIPEDKEIYLHCATGARAKMGWAYLKQHRKKVKYLKAKVVSRKGKMKVRP